LIFPTVIGTAWLAWFGYRYKNAVGIVEAGSDGKVSTMSKVEYALDSEINVILGLLTTLWATLFVESWKRKQRTIQYIWNCKDISFSRQDEREETFQYYDVYNHRTGNVEKHRKLISTCKNILYRVFSFLCLLIIIAVMVAYRGVNDQSKRPDGKYYGWGLYISIAYSCLVVVFGIMYKWLSAGHTDAENHRYQRHHDDALITRLFVVNFLNFYLPAITIALDTENGSSYMDIFQLLLTQLAVKQVSLNLLEYFLPILKTKWQLMKLHDRFRKVINQYRPLEE